jgi:hypothetical protein
VNESLRLIPLNSNTMNRHQVKQHSPVFYFSVNNFNSVIRGENAKEILSRYMPISTGPEYGPMASFFGQSENWAS